MLNAKQYIEESKGVTCEESWGLLTAPYPWATYLTPPDTSPFTSFPSSSALGFANRCVPECAKSLGVPSSVTVRQTGQFPETYPIQKNERGDSRCLGRVPSWARQHFQALSSRKDQVLNNSIRGRGGEGGANYRLPCTESFGAWDFGREVWPGTLKIVHLHSILTQNTDATLAQVQAVCFYTVWKSGK